MTGLLGRDQLLELLAEVGETLAERGLVGHLYVVGGAAMSLAFDSRRTTRDVDAKLGLDGDAVAAAARVVAERHGLAPDWINSAASAFLPNRADDDAQELTFPGLRVAIASPEHLMAMKLRALRDRDLDDLVVLFDHLGITTPEQAARIHDALFDESDIGYAGPDESLYAARQVFARAARLGRSLGGS